MFYRMRTLEVGIGDPLHFHVTGGKWCAVRNMALLLLQKLHYYLTFSKRSHHHRPFSKANTHQCQNIICRIDANSCPVPVFFFCCLRCRGLYSRRASIRDRTLLIHRFSTAFKAPIMVCVSQKKKKYAPSIIARKIISYLRYVQNQVTVLVKNQYQVK